MPGNWIARQECRAYGGFGRAALRRRRNAGGYHPSNAPAFTFFGPRGTKQSEVFPVRSLTFTENDVALPVEKGNLEYAGLSLVYEGNRVKSALLGRDLNPLGRGDTDFYPAGAFSLEKARPKGPRYVWTGNGNSVNNDQQSGIGSSPQGNFNAAQMLACGKSLYPGRMCPICPVLQVNPCPWTTIDELCKCIRKAACAAYDCWKGIPYCCENVYHLCTCLCCKPLDCLVGGCGGDGGGGGGGNVAPYGGCGSCCGGGGGGGAGGTGGGPQRMPGGTGSGDQGSSQSTGQDKLKECEDAWDAAVDKLCNCIAQKHPEIADAEKYGNGIAECCKHRPSRAALREGGFLGLLWNPCYWGKKIAVAGLGVGEGCRIWVCCPNFLESTTLYTEDRKPAVSEPKDQDCIRLTVVAIKFWQCCHNYPNPGHPFATADDARKIHDLIHCCCDSATWQETLGGPQGAG